MNKENEFNLNLSYNSEDKVSIISISNKSKSNSFHNPKSIKRPKKLNKKIISNQNSSSFSIHQKKNKKINSKEQNSFSFYTYTQNSSNKFDESKDKKEKKEENKSVSNKEEEKKIKIENETPKRKREKNNIKIEKFEYKKKDLLNIDNINGKNLMDYFEKMSENITTEEKKKDRISSVENKLKESFKIKNTVININKSWNKKSNNFYLPSKMLLKIINKKEKNSNLNFRIRERYQSINSHNTSTNIKNLQILLSQNNINIDLKNLIDKYRPNKILKKRINNNTISADKTMEDNKLKFEKIKQTLNSDSKKERFSFSHLKIRDSTIKNLFHENNNNNIKINDEMTNINKYINKNERKPNEKIYEKSNFFNPQIKKKNTEIIFQLNKNNNLMMNTKKKETKIGNFFLKHKEKIETDKIKKSGI